MEAANSEIIFFCKDCQEVVPTSKMPGKYVYKCRKCGTKNVAFGTKKSIHGFFHIEEEEVQEVKKEEKKEVQAETQKTA